MFENKMSRLAAIGLVAVSLVGASATAAVAAPQANGSDGPVYVYDSNTETRLADDFVYPWDLSVVGSPDPTDARAPFVCPADAEYVRTFLAPKGQERVQDNWSAYAEGGFNPGTKEILEYAVTPIDQILGLPGQGAVKITGGNYSAGVACLKDNRVNFASAGVWYTDITIKPGSGTYTVALPSGGPVVTPVDPSQQGSIDISAGAIAAVDGALSLEVPAGATATLAAPTLVNNLSTATGTLPTFTVKDGRVVSMKGWDLTATVKDFANTAETGVTIDAKQLGIAPKVVTTTASGVAAAAAHIAGSTTPFTTFASAPAGQAVGDTVLGADLTFVAPAGKAAGTYTSKLTLTLASK